jgi:hypothetical protein
METEAAEEAPVPVPVVPVKDPDGWETVARGKKSKKGT